jgi:hypothetical protein
MRAYPRTTFAQMRLRMAKDLLEAPVVEVGEWQAKKLQDADWVSKEIQNVIFEIDVPDRISDLKQLVDPNLPWAEDHFLERVSGIPYNPPPSSEYWPYTQSNHEEFVDKAGRFSHTYPERFWPVMANAGATRPNGREIFVPHNGIRYEYGDLGDVVTQLKKSLLTRQAYLPVWFPEDTGAVSEQRVPCTLGYHFMVRFGQLNCTYLIRSCDFMRHFADDVYMAARLVQWMSDQIKQPTGSLTMWVGSFHIFQGDIPILKYKYKLGGAGGQD